MYLSIWNAVLPHLSAERMKAEIAEFYELSRWSSYDKIQSLAQQIATRMQEIGMEDVRLIGAPADGKTAFGGWVIPEAYDVDEARLSASVDGMRGEILADYAVNPTCLMMYSMSTPAGGMDAELVVADSIADLTPGHLAGKMVLSSGIGVELGEAAMRAGAVGIVSDCRNGRRFTKEGPYLDDTNEWHNFTIPPWHDPGKGFGFSITPRQGARLRESIAAGQDVEMHAVVKTRHYSGVLPAISGLLPGRSREEIVLTGHFDEFGADDNCSQIVVGFETIRAIIRLVQTGKIPPLERTIRLLFPMEVRGFNALIQDKAETARMKVGLNIDTVGTDQNATTASCSLVETLPALPSFADDLAADLLERVSAENPLFRWRRIDAEVIDNILGEPLVGAPTPAIYHFSGHHHVALDTPDRVSEKMLLDMARLTATYAAFLAGAGFKEALWLAELSALKGERRMRDAAARVMAGVDDKTLASLIRRIGALNEDCSRRIGSPHWIVPRFGSFPTLEGMGEAGISLIGENRLMPVEEFAARVSFLCARLDYTREEAETTMRRQSLDLFGVNVPVRVEAMPKSRCVPVKSFRGYHSSEDLSWEERARLLKDTGLPSGWGSPMWLQNALMFANGKRTADEIESLLIDRGAGNLPDLEPIFEFLATKGMVRLRPYITQKLVKEALEQAGVGAGDMLLAHFSLSRFGYIEGGADALIDTILEVLGPSGTLAVPTFTFSWIGRQPYNPTQTPSRVGAVTDYFWRRAGVMRSAHPTHSLAAIGPLAPTLLEGHDHTMPPLSQAGPFGKLADHGAKILMFAPPGSNTSLHVGEYWSGIPYPDILCPILERGERREVPVPHCPWHVRFDAAYERLYKEGKILDVPLGEGTIHVMNCRDAIQAQTEIAVNAPESLIEPGCECPYCTGISEQCC